MNLECGFSLHLPSWAELTPSHFCICNLQPEIRVAQGGKRPCLERPPQAVSAAGLSTESGCCCHLSVTSMQPPHSMAMTPGLLLRKPLFQGHKDMLEPPVPEACTLDSFYCLPKWFSLFSLPSWTPYRVCQLSRRPPGKDQCPQAAEGESETYLW